MKINCKCVTCGHKFTITEAPDPEFGPECPECGRVPCVAIRASSR